MEPYLPIGRVGLTLDHAVFIRQHTELLNPPLVPEVQLYLAHEAVPLWQKTEEELGKLGLPPPFWAFAWAGGQALARYILDNREIVKGRKIVDLASGSGLVAIATMKAGASACLAADIDAFAIAAIGLNATANNVVLQSTSEDLLERDQLDCDVMLIGDLFYEKALAARVFDFASKAQQHGTQVFIGDPARAYLPREKLEKVTEYSVPVSRDLEDAEIKRAAVWKLA